jgi:hypothetical protein
VHLVGLRDAEEIGHDECDVEHRTRDERPDLSPWPVGEGP